MVRLHILYNAEDDQLYNMKPEKLKEMSVEKLEETIERLDNLDDQWDAEIAKVQSRHEPYDILRARCTRMLKKKKNDSE